MQLLAWLFRAFVFFALFAFALNNQQEVTVRWFFGYVWSAPMVIVVLAAFAAGCAIGILAMVPRWWRHKRAARAAHTAAPSTDAAAVAAPSTLIPSSFGAEAALPPRDPR